MDKKDFTIAGPETIHQATMDNLHEIDDIKDQWVANRLAHLHSEISGAYEGLRNHDMECFKKEMADTILYVIDLCYHLGINIEEEVHKKMKQHADGFKHHTVGNPYS